MSCIPSVALVCALAVVPLLAACGGGGNSEEPEAVAYTAQSSATCLRRAGVTKLDQNAGEDLEDANIAAEGALEGSFGKVNFAVVFEPDGATAVSTETQYAATAGGTWQPGVPIGELLKRADNAVLVYEKKPTEQARQAIEGCFGGKPATDPEVNREYGR